MDNDLKVHALNHDFEYVINNLNEKYFYLSGNNININEVVNKFDNGIR